MLFRSGRTTVVGTSGSETLTTVAGSNLLVGNGGTDTYGIVSGATVVEILNGVGPSAAGGTAPGTASGTLSFLSGSVGSTNLWFERTNGAGALSATGANLRVSVLGTSQVAIVDSFFPTVGPLKPLSSFTAGGLTLDTGFANVLAAMRAYELAHTGFSAATASGTITDPTVLAAVNAAWH